MKSPQTSRFPLALAGLLAIAAPLGGCFVSTDDPPPSRTVVIDPNEPASQDATLVVTWTIAGLTDPNECTKALATNIEISIADSSGVEIAAYQQSCTAFSTSITLNAGTYSAFAVLLAQDGTTRTTDAPIAPFTLRANESLTVPVDFPERFLPLNPRPSHTRQRLSG